MKNRYQRQAQKIIAVILAGTQIFIAPSWAVEIQMFNDQPVATVALDAQQNSLAEIPQPIQQSQAEAFENEAPPMPVVAVDEPTLPAGWTRAPSNPNFAFQVSHPQTDQYALKLQDLRNGQIQQLVSGPVSTGNVPNIFDVSPDGLTVVYEGNATPAITPNSVIQSSIIYIQRIANAQEPWFFQGNLQAVEFVADNRIKINIVDALGENRELKINLAHFHIDESIPSNTGIKIERIAVLNPNGTTTYQMKIRSLIMAVGEYELQYSADLVNWQNLQHYTAEQIGQHNAYYDPQTAQNRFYRIKEVTQKTTSPDGSHVVLQAGWYLIIQDNQKHELHRFQVAAQQANLQSFSVTNAGVYTVISDHSNILLKFTSFEDFSSPAIPLPERVVMGNTPGINFVAPGIADIRALDMITYRVNLETGMILQEKEGDTVRIYDSEEGFLIAEETYSNGALIHRIEYDGVWKFKTKEITYHANTQPAEIIIYGQWAEFIIHRETYDSAGRPISIEIYDESMGNLRQTVSYYAGTNVIQGRVHYYSNGYAVSKTERFASNGNYIRVSEYARDGSSTITEYDSATGQITSMKQYDPHGRLIVPITRDISPASNLNTGDITPVTNVMGLARVTSFNETMNVTGTSRGVHMQYQIPRDGFAGGGYLFSQYAPGTGSIDLSQLENIVVGLRGDSSDIKMELIDENGAHSFVHLHGISASQENIYSIPTSLFSGEVDLRKITIMYFIVESGGAGSMDVNLNVDLQGLNPPLLISGTLYNQSAITSLPSNPILASSHGTTGGGDDDASVVMNQTSTTTFGVNSSNPDTGDFTYSQISWGYFDASNNFVGNGANVGNSVTLALNGIAGKTLKVEFLSTLGVKRLFSVVLGAGQQNYTFNLTGLGQLAVINFVSEQPGLTNYTVETKGLRYIPNVNGAAYNQAAISALPGSPVVANSRGTTTATDNSTITTTQTSATTFAASSNNPDTGDFTISKISWGYFDDQNVFIGTNANLGSSVTLALNGTAGKVLKIEFTNAFGVKKLFNVVLSASQQNYTFNLTGFTQPMAAIHFVSDQAGTTNYTVETKGLTYVPVVAGAAYNQAAISALPQNPVVVGSLGTTTDTDDSVIMMNQTSTTTFGVQSINPDMGDFTFSSISWGYFDAGNIFIGTGGNVGNSVTLALNGTAGKEIKVEFLNTAGVRKLFKVTLSGAQQNYTFDLTGFAQPMAAISFVSEQIGATNYTVETKGLRYYPAAVITASSVTNFSGQQPSVHELEPFASNTVTSFVQDSASHIAINYNLANGVYGRWAAGVIQFDVAPYNATNGIILGMRASGTSALKIEVLDSNGRKSIVRALGVTGSYQNYQITSAMLLAGAQVAGFDRTQISGIVIVVDDQMAGSATAMGTIDVNTQGLQYTTVLSPSSLAPADITPLPGTSWVDYVAPAGNPTRVTAIARGMQLNYDTRIGGWGGGGFIYDQAGTPAIETQNLDSLTELRFGIQGGVDQAKVEFVDDQDRKVSLKLLQINAMLENVYVIPTALIRSLGFDLTKTKVIYFIVEKPNAVGVLNIFSLPPAMMAMALTEEVQAAALLKTPQAIVLPRKPFAGVDLRNLNGADRNGKDKNLMTKKKKKIKR